MSINTDKGKHLNLFTSSPKTKNKISNKAFDMMTAAADKSAIDFSKQDIQFGLDEKKIEEKRQDDLYYVEGAAKKQTERDVLKEESFEDFLYKLETSPVPWMRDKIIQKAVPGENPKDARKIFESRLHTIWKNIGSPLIKFQDPKKVFPAGTSWQEGQPSDFITPWIMDETNVRQYSNNISDILEGFLDNNKYESRYGKLTDQDKNYWNTSKGRMDTIQIKEGDEPLWAILQEMTHQMQGVRQTGTGVQFMDELAVEQESNIPNRYANTETIEGDAHIIKKQYLMDALAGDEKAINLIKLLEYPYYKPTMKNLSEY
jgi:hypothetical protein